ncbi:MAG: hypothetical protein ACLFQE_07875 [Thermotogota bacterium]
MKKDVLKLDGSAATEEKALDGVEQRALSFGFDEKDAAFARLLAEEAINAFSLLIGVKSGYMWIEEKENDFEIHLEGNADLGSQERNRLIELSKNKKNTARKGILGKISSFIDYIASDSVVGENPFIFYEMSNDMVIYSSVITPSGKAAWTMQDDEKVPEENDKALKDIEKSIIEKFADDIIVSIALKKIELIIKKTKK